MPIIVVTSAEQGAGKTGVAAAIARHVAYTGQPARLVRIASDAGGTNADADASWFGSLNFVPGSPAFAVTPAGVSATAEEIVVVEADGSAAGSIPDASYVVVGREGQPVAVEGIEAAATVVTRARTLPAAGEAEPGTPAIVLVEDRTLNGFGVDEVQALLHAEVLVEGDPTDETCDDLVIAPIASDAGQPYFKRFGSKAVVARFDKTDMHLAAMQSDPVCLILSGGRRPSEYLFDAASAQGITVLLSRTDTENTVIALERIFERTRFSGGRKLDRMAELLEATPLFEALGL
jgi:BioD-like phosphotransacetylase family protein